MAALGLLCGIFIIILLDHGVLADPKNCTGSQEDHICQYPRFLAEKKGRTVHFYCLNKGPPSGNISVKWFIKHSNGSFNKYIESSDPDFHAEIFVSKCYSTLKLSKIHQKNNGVYFCKFNMGRGDSGPECGSELRVLDCGKPDVVKARNTLKDAIIIIQTLLIILFTTGPALLLWEMKRRSVTLEDHTYEGLEIDHTATYEDILAVRIPSTKLMVGEHPCQE
ncbi:B-cell antigen receptor complex-associated protein beta chain isoform 2-T2 [Discoglossus pictus]